MWMWPESLSISVRTDPRAELEHQNLREAPSVAEWKWGWGECSKTNMEHFGRSQGNLHSPCAF